MKTRREFIASAAALTTGAAASMTLSNQDQGKGSLIHQVLFWLKNPESKEDRDQLVKGLRTLSEIATVRSIHIGIPADTEKREVVDNSFSVSELIFFDDIAGQNTYQEHPIHVKFVSDCSHLWKKVVVYDSTEV